MKKFGLNLAGMAACLALAAILGWSTLPTNADAGGNAVACPKAGTCPLSAAKSVALKESAGSCCASKAAASLSAKGDSCCSEGASKDIASLLMNDSRFTTLALAVKAAGLEGEFQCPLQKTVLAPTNEAFQKITADQWAAILQDDAKLKALVTNHIIKDGAIECSTLKEAKSAKSAGGFDISLSKCPVSGQVSVNNAKVVGEELVASNGVVHAIDNVLMPAGMQVAQAEEEASVQVAAAK